MKNTIKSIKYKLKEDIDDKQIYTNPTNFEFIKTLSKDSFFKFDYYTNNNFCVFKSINDILSLIYSNRKKSIISFDIINNQKINEIKNAHLYYIVDLIHFFDKINNRDLILSLSGKKLVLKTIFVQMADTLKD